MEPTVNPDAVLSYYDYIDAEAYEDVFSLFADDIVYERPGQQSLSGMEEFREFYLDGRPLEDGEHEIGQVVVGDDTVAVRGRFSGVQNGKRVSFGFSDFHRFDADGKITERTTYTDRDTV
ncbi:nuclear transport factor 2 family protein [Haladaptatus pallidirubidus]|uniref:Nuclear transport factor 2 family protein n=1 Tax=Haladaptatus pallidirubidus TaxID=1008152 RepID=A0AAV3UAK5_9EURY|nr:nuclear transport factor 2 family protein [Haladaptatus pallidirubidus]